MKNSRGKMLLFTLIMIAVALAATFFFGELSDKPFDIGDWSDTDVETARRAFLDSGDSGELVTLVKALAWRYKAMGDEQAAAPLKQFGQILLDRAKSREVDLEDMDADGTLLQTLEIVREVGAR